jgi:hypothetical protein
MTEYKDEFRLPARSLRTLAGILADAWESAGVTNLRLAETEKYAHVTYFFNGGVERIRRREPVDGAFGEGRHVRSPAADGCARDHRPGRRGSRAGSSTRS